MNKALLVTLVLMASACNGVRKLDEAGLRAFVHDEGNGLKQTKIANGFKITSTYRPSDLIAKQQMMGNEMSEFDSLANLYSKFTYFVVDISKNDRDLETMFASDGGDFASRVTYLSSQFSHKFQVVTEGKTISLTEFIYTRSYGITASQFLVAFEDVPMVNFRLLIDGRELGFNELTFDFEKTNIEKLPRLQF